MMRSGVFASRKASRRPVEQYEQIRLGNHKYTVIEKPQTSTDDVEMGINSCCFVVQDVNEDGYYIYNNLTGRLSKKYSTVQRLDVDMFVVNNSDKHKTRKLYFNDEEFIYEEIKNAPEVMLMGNLDDLLKVSEFPEHSVLTANKKEKC